MYDLVSYCDVGVKTVGVKYSYECKVLRPVRSDEQKS